MTQQAPDKDRQETSGLDHLGPWIEDRQGHNSSHPSPALLQDLVQDRVSISEREQLEDHIVLCEECQNLVLDLKTFDSLQDQTSEIVDGEQLRTTWARISDESTGSHETLQPWASKREIPWLLAACLALICVTQAWWLFGEKPETRMARPQLIQEIIPIASSRSMRSVQNEHPPLPNDMDHILSLTPPGLSDMSDIQVVLRQVDSEDPPLELEASRSLSGSILLHLPAQSLIPGDYEVELRHEILPQTRFYFRVTRPET